LPLRFRFRCCLRSRTGDRTAGSLDRRLGPGRRTDALERDRLADFAGLDDLDDPRHLADEARRLQGQQIDLGRIEPLQVGQRDLGVVLERGRLEAALGQTALQRHLTTLEADLVVAAGARLLALVAATRGLAEPRADAAADAALGVLGAARRLNGVEFHVLRPCLRGALTAPSQGTRPC
jgi:hypothetical protein